VGFNVSKKSLSSQSLALVLVTAATEQPKEDIRKTRKRTRTNRTSPTDWKKNTL